MRGPGPAQASLKGGEPALGQANPPATRSEGTRGEIGGLAPRCPSEPRHEPIKLTPLGWQEKLEAPNPFARKMDCF